MWLVSRVIFSASLAKATTMTRIVWAAATFVVLGASGFAWAQPSNLERSIADLRSSDAKQQIAAANALADLGPAADSAVTPLIEASGAENAEVRMHVARALAAIRSAPERTVPALVKLLDDRDAAVRARAAMGLAQFPAPNERVVAALAKKLTDESPDVRRAAMRALHRLQPDSKALLPVVVKVLEDSDPAVIVPALHTLAEAGDDVVPALIEAMESHKSRYWACVVLAEIGPDAKAAVPALTKAFKSDEHVECRMQAALALGEIGPEARPAVDELIRALGDKNMSIQYAATFALGRIGDAKSADALAKLNDSRDPLLSMLSTWAVAMVKPDDKQATEAAVKSLAAGLKNEQPHVRQAAARGLLELKAPPEVAAPHIASVLNDKDPKVAAEAIDALASLGEQVAPRAAKALEEPEFRVAAARVLGRLGPQAKEATPALVKSLDADDPEFRREVIFTLSRIGPAAAEAAPALTKLIESQEEPTALSAMYALGSIGPAAKDAVAALNKQTESDSFLRRVTAAWALASIQPDNKQAIDKATPLLSEALKNEQEFVRLNAAIALGRLGPAARAAAPALQTLDKDPSPAVRAAAEEALRRMARE